MAGQIFTNYKVGLQNVGSYQVSGKPFASGSIDASTAVSIAFPSVTRWVQVINNDDKACRVGFSVQSINNPNVSPSAPYINWSGSSGVG